MEEGKLGIACLILGEKRRLADKRGKHFRRILKMITIKQREGDEQHFQKFNFTFYINYLFYLFKHRILIILNSPRVCSPPFFALVFWKFSHLSFDARMSDEDGGKGAWGIFQEEKLLAERNENCFSRNARQHSLRSFLLRTVMGKCNKNSLPVILREKQFSV